MNTYSVRTLTNGRWTIVERLHSRGAALSYGRDAVKLGGISGRWAVFCGSRKVHDTADVTGPLAS